MTLKISKLTFTLVFSCLCIIALPQAVHAMENFEKAAEQSTGDKENRHFRTHRHHEHKHLWNANFISGGVESKLDDLTLQELMHKGMQRGVLEGTSQVVAYAIVKLAFMGGEFIMSPTKTAQREQLQQQQLETLLTELDKNLRQSLEQANKNGTMINALVDSAVKLNDEEAKKLALAALKKYAEQVHTTLDMQKLAYEQTLATAQQLMKP